MKMEIGFKFECFEVISEQYVIKVKNKYRYYVNCKCICGKIIKKRTDTIQTRRKYSCGCIKRPKKSHVLNGKQICSSCNKDKDISEYFKRSRSPDGIGRYCITCTRKKVLEKSYGISLEEYESMLNKQDKSCKCCGTKDPNGWATSKKKKFSFVVDHCHKTGKIRGLLCNSCNIGIGGLQDSSEGVLKAYNYLKNFEDKNSS